MKEHRLRTFGLDRAALEALVNLQGDKCAICATPFSECTMCIDHDHDIGLARGLLCAACNAGVGMFKDTPELFMGAVEYLANPPAKPIIEEKQEIDRLAREERDAIRKEILGLYESGQPIPRELLDRLC